MDLENLETTKIHSVIGGVKEEDSCVLVHFDPPITPSLMWHWLSALSQPGEISLAHNGVLFLDELPEFKQCLRGQRQPLEDRVTISNKIYCLLLASFMLVAV